MILLALKLSFLEIVGFLSAFLVGISLGLLGSGGSALTMPVLIYIFKINEKLATAYSLFIVGSSALLASYRYGLKKLINYKVATYFGLPSVLGVVLVRYYLIQEIPENIISFDYLTITSRNLILGLFSILMIIAGYQMIKKKKHIKKRVNKKFNSSLAVLEGIGVGSLTGLVGAGGGFLIVPSLILLYGLKMKVAIGTSLFIISFKSLLGFFIGDVQKNLIDWEFLGAFSFIALLGIIIGLTLSQHIKTKLLKKGFGFFVIGLGIIMISLEFII